MRWTRVYSELIYLLFMNVVGIWISVLFAGPVIAQYPQIKWWYDLGAPSFGSAAVADLDGDGHLEIVFGTYFNDEQIHVLNAEDGSQLWSFNTGGCNDASPVIFDVDLDGELEVIVPASSPARVYCFSGADGQVEWSASTGASNCIDSPPAVADIDLDGKLEVVLGTFYGYVFAFNGENGSECWQVNLGTDSYIQSCPCILDVDGDNHLEVIVAQFAGDCRVYALKGDTGATLWYSSLPQDYMYHGASFADIDEDGKHEIAIGCYDGKVYVLNAEDGSQCWEYQAPVAIAAPTSLGDINNDNHLEVLFAAYNTIYALSYTGSHLWHYSTGGSVFRGTVLADITGDQTIDVVFASADGHVRAVHGPNGQLIWDVNLQRHYGNVYDMDHAPVIADFDEDGELDVFVIGGYGTSSTPQNNHGRAYMLTAGPGNQDEWLMFRHDPRHSGNYGYQIPAVPALSWVGVGLITLLIGIIIRMRLH
ncbi:PQQ-binding-like beta-propeller repeat protein [bacterium]|nr:PQQ-binding-like beta-propeller repeat protein [bacterium]